MTNIFWVCLTFLVGALPFSVWVGKLALGQDIQQVGDGNPGSWNVMHVGGMKWGMLAMLLDFLKGALPVGLAHFGLGMGGWLLAAMALAPVLGHAFSPFLRFRGGKALAVTFGIWSGLSLWLVPSLLGFFFAVWLALGKTSSVAVLLGFLCLLPALALLHAPPVWYPLWAANVLILAWKHRQELGRASSLRFE